MIWLSWRQFRTSAFLAIAALSIAAVFLGITGAYLSHYYDTSGIATCQASHGECQPLIDQFLRNYNTLRPLIGIGLLAVPAILGMFWGAPLITRELESGTYRLAWTQSVTRGHWLAVKLAMVALATMVVAGLISLRVTWWFASIDHVNANRFNPGVFDERGIVAIGYAAFAFALGVATGMLFRRTLPAMATTLAAFIGVRLAVAFWVRPHLMAPAHQAIALDPAATGFGSSNGGPFTLEPAPPSIQNAWIYSTQIVDKAGHAITSQFVAAACPNLGDGGPANGAPGTRVQVPAAMEQALRGCVVKVGASYHEVVTFQPASRYWTFQAIETAIFVGLALVLSAFCLWWVSRRLT